MDFKYKHYLKIEFSPDLNEGDIDKIKYWLEEHFNSIDYSGKLQKNINPVKVTKISYTKNYEN